VRDGELERWIEKRERGKEDRERGMRTGKKSKYV
jgi:hypothetical protein